MTRASRSTDAADPRGKITIRPLQLADVEATERVSDLTFVEADRRSRRVSDPEPEMRTADERAAWLERAAHFLAHDPGGCWIACRGDDVIGFALAQRRGGCWYLWTYGVLPGHQGHGVGAALMDTVLAHAEGLPGMLSSTIHPAATRRYRLAGFELHPQMRMVGEVDRTRLPAVADVVEGDTDDIEWMDELDVRRRGGGHGPDHELLLATHHLLCPVRHAAATCTPARTADRRCWPPTRSRRRATSCSPPWRPRRVRRW
jgi:GNAT superfamily N-acetyltransferase